LKRFVSEHRCQKCGLRERYAANGACCHCQDLRTRAQPRRRPLPVLPALPWELRA
jgi:hypothetical protein